MTHEEAKKMGVTHYVENIMFLGLVYIKYIDGFPWFLSKNHWYKCNKYFDSEPL